MNSVIFELEEAYVDDHLIRCQIKSADLDVDETGENTKKVLKVEFYFALQKKFKIESGESIEYYDGFSNTETLEFSFYDTSAKIKSDLETYWTENYQEKDQNIRGNLALNNAVI